MTDFPADAIVHGASVDEAVAAAHLAVGGRPMVVHSTRQLDDGSWLVRVEACRPSTCD